MSITSLLDYTDATSLSRRGSGTPNTESSKAYTLIATNKKIAQRQVINAIFEECIPYTTDSFWKKILYMAARGKFPKGYFYRDRFICQKKKGNVRSVFIPGSPIQAVEVFITFMHDAGMYSNIDKDHRKEQMLFAVSMEDIKLVNDWSKVPKKMRYDYIDVYVNRICDDHQLSDNCRISMRKIIRLGVTLKIFNKDTICMENGSISFIHGLRYDQPTDTFIIEPRIWDEANDRILSTRDQPPYDPLDIVRPNPIYLPDGVPYRSKWEKQVNDYIKVSQAGVKVAKQMEMRNVATNETVTIGTGQLIIID